MLQKEFDKVFPIIIEESLKDPNSILNKGIVEAIVETQVEAIEKPRKEIELCSIC
jgi:hypothetical protein